MKFNCKPKLGKRKVYEFDGDGEFAVDGEFDVKPISSIITSKLPGLEIFENMEESDFLEEKFDCLKYSHHIVF